MRASEASEASTAVELLEVARRLCDESSVKLKQRRLLACASLAVLVHKGEREPYDLMWPPERAWVRAMLKRAARGAERRGDRAAERLFLGTDGGVFEGLL